MLGLERIQISDWPKHNFRNAMRKNYIHAFKTRCMEAWMVHRPFASEELYHCRQKAVLYWKTWKTRNILPLVSLIGYRHPLKREASSSEQGQFLQLSPFFEDRPNLHAEGLPTSLKCLAEASLQNSMATW